MLRRTYFILAVRKVLGFALALVGVWPAIAGAQSLSFLKTLPAGPPPWNAAAAAADATGIYIAESDRFLRKYDRDGAGWRKLGFSDQGMAVRRRCLRGGLTQNNDLVDASTTLGRLWSRQFGSPDVQCLCHGAAALGVYRWYPSSGAYASTRRGAELWTKSLRR
jgi:hypothetical protein